jgi:hypothetical protein
LLALVPLDGLAIVMGLERGFELAFAAELEPFLPKRQEILGAIVILSLPGWQVVYLCLIISKKYGRSTAPATWGGAPAP